MLQRNINKSFKKILKFLKACERYKSMVEKRTFFRLNSFILLCYERGSLWSSEGR